MEFVLKLEKPFIFSSHMLRNKNKKIKTKVGSIIVAILGTVRVS